MQKYLLTLLMGSIYAILAAQPPAAQHAPVLPQIHASAQAWADFNLDGRPDLFLAGTGNTGQRISVLLRNDSTAFTPILTSIPPLNEAAAAWADYDGDGDPDLLVSGRSANGGITQLWRNDGTAGFNQVALPAPPLCAGTLNWSDLDNDGDLDILLTGYNYDQIFLSTILRNDGSSQFNKIPLGELANVAHSATGLANLDGDSLPEIALSGYDAAGSPVFEIYKNLGGFAFTPISHSIPAYNHGSLHWADYDNDNDPDLLICGATPHKTTSLYINTNGNFSAINTSLPQVSLGGARWADFNLDGRMDLLLCGLAASGAIATIYKQNPNGSFSDNQASRPLFPVHNPLVSWADWSGDGYPDFVISGQDSSWQPVSLLYKYFPLSGEFKY
ncbi:MAG TPA: VCBS repeat-containing protein [Bacteroidetes bacterium]|nr:VCBS repeat-containing protein [Bacteroidota bacterium]